MQYQHPIQKSISDNSFDWTFASKAVHFSLSFVISLGATRCYFRKDVKCFRHLYFSLLLSSIYTFNLGVEKCHSYRDTFRCVCVFGGGERFSLEMLLFLLYRGSGGNVIKKSIHSSKLDISTFFLKVINSECNVMMMEEGQWSGGAHRLRRNSGGAMAASTWHSVMKLRRRRRFPHTQS